jgi:hypothetical protein
MAFGPSPIRFLRRPSEAPLLSAGPEKVVECWRELGASGFTFAWVKFRQRRVWRYGDLPYLQPFWRAYDPSSDGSRAKSRRNARDEDPFIAKIHAGQNLFRC